jgi:hypothetical protein
MSLARGANWRTGLGRLIIAFGIAWIVGWSVFFVYLVAFETPRPLDYLTYVLIILAPPGALFLITWVVQGFRAKS